MWQSRFMGKNDNSRWEGISFTMLGQRGGELILTYETKTKFVECAICKRITSDTHAEKFLDIWICCWCGN